MIERMRTFLKNKPWLPFVLGGLGFLLYLWLTWHLSQTLGVSSLDESMYAYKGYLFASGKYAPYQDYGPSTNHMPLAFMIPGWVQLWFGPGMGTVRVFAFLTGALMLAGICLAFYRLGGAWWAAGAAWLFALNPSWQEIFSQGLTQGLVSAFLAWSFVFLLGRERKTWQLALAAGLAALAVMTRINIAPVLGLMLLFIFWQHGWQKGLYASLAGAAVGIIVLAVFWPGVLKFISGWIPEGLLGFVEPYRSSWSQQHVSDDFSYFPIDWFDDRNSEQWNGVNALFESFHLNLVPYLAGLGTLVFWPKKKDWPGDLYRFRLSLFLLVAWWVMVGFHMWVALSGTSCPFFCLSGYFSFFNILALLLLPAALPYWWSARVAVWRRLVGLAVLFGVVGGALKIAGFRMRRVRGRWIALMDVQIPRLKDGRIIWGETGPLRGIFEAKLGLSYRTLTDVVPQYLYWILLVLLVFGVTALLFKIFKKRAGFTGAYAGFALLAFLSAAVVLSPTPVFYSDTAFVKCSDSVVDSHEVVGAEMAALFPEGAQVYWEVTSNMLLLYLPQVEIFPPQLNTSFNFVDDSLPGEQDEIYRFGYWDKYLQADLLEEAEYFVISGERYDRWEDVLTSGIYSRVDTTSPYELCREKDTMVYVFLRLDSEE